MLVITVCYLLLHATPGGPFDAERKVSPEVLANLQAKYHLGEPLWKQYLLYLEGLLHGDLGASFRYADWSVNELVLRALPVSLTIGGVSMLLAFLIGVSLGILAALYRNSPADYLLMLVGNAGSAFPSFVIGPVLILVFAIVLKWLPAGGWNGFEIRYMVLPVTLLTMINVSPIARVMRASLIEVMSGNYIRTAYAKGLSGDHRVSARAEAGLDPGRLADRPDRIASITAAVVTESVFSLPGSAS